MGLRSSSATESNGNQHGHKEAQISTHYCFPLILVDDMPKMWGFYTRTLGFEPQGDGTAAHEELKRDGGALALCKRQVIVEQLDGHPSTRRHKGWSFEIVLMPDSPEELAVLFEAICAGGGRKLRAPRVEPWGGTSAFVLDPEDNLIELFANAPKK